jgi:hypothetical protein
MIGSNTGLLGILEHEGDAIMTPVAAAKKRRTIRPQGFPFDYRRRSKDRDSSQKTDGLFSVQSSLLDVVLHR